MGFSQPDLWKEFWAGSKRDRIYDNPRKYPDKMQKYSRDFRLDGPNIALPTQWT